MMARQMIHMHVKTFLFVSVACIVSGCGTMGARSRIAGNPQMSAPLLEVENQHWQEIRVYLMRGQSARRLVGSIEAGASEVFRLPFADFGEVVYILIQPVGLRSATYQIPEPVTTGQRIVLRIANILNRSVVWVPGAV